MEFTDDAQAVAFLQERGIREIRNGILSIPRDRVPTDDEWEAIDYLTNDWDFDYAFDA